MKKRQKTLSMLLVIIFLFGIVTPQSVIAYEGDTVSKRYYSGLTKEEQLKLVTEVKADGEFFQECEEKGYTIEESKGIFYLNDVFLFTIDEGGRFLESDRDNTKIQGLSKLESIFTSETSIDKKEQLKELIQDEYSVDSIKDAYDMATILKANVNDFIAKDAVINNEEELLKIKERYGDLEVELLREMLKCKSFNVKGLMDWAEQNDKNIFQIYMSLSEATQDLPKLQMDSEASSSIQSLKAINSGGTQESKEYIPFKMEHNTKESINISNGSLSLENPNYGLEGRNGLDLNIATKYNSREASIYDVKSQIIYYESKYEYIDYFLFYTPDNKKTLFKYNLGRVNLQDLDIDKREAELYKKAEAFMNQNPPHY